ncbi:TetR/AcrR family transcriptional regulator [Hymenobacter sp. HSC-4F20]|uniref:TetR/AcrR family transcriptional regulator n=1 Tax=Hymenobacter sp. HSC-4F20 TaxID=2864135 RepID=UPI001C72B688|nr:TetR family transcriptional regulator [Hymenobacter sp. HSC-4F20]MBX0291847.1 TetR/AcrR family transcriptional regulator [Hymenobacter sp. HSC-4F20]
MEKVVLQKLLDGANTLFLQVGVGMVHEEQLAAALDVSPATFRELFGSKAGLLRQVVQHNLARQRAEHELLLQNLATPVECLLALLHHSLQEMRRSPHFDYHVLREQFPGAWAVVQEYLAQYITPLLTRLLQAGIQEGHFRAELDARLIAHLLLAQFHLLLDEQLFPPDYTNLAEVYRNLFFPYVRGLCTEAGARLVRHHFARL